MLSVTIPNISLSQNTPVLPNIRRIATRPSGASCSRRNSAKLSLATILRPPSWPGGLCSRRIAQTMLPVSRTVAGSVQKLSHFRGLVLRGRIGRFPIWCSPGRGHHTICSKLHAKPEERSGGHVRRLSAQVFSLARIPIDLSSGKVRHDIRDEKFTSLFVVPLIIAIDQQVDAGVLVLPDQVDGLGHRTDKAAQRSTGSQPLALRPQRGRVAAQYPGLDTPSRSRMPRPDRECRATTSG